MRPIGVPGPPPAERYGAPERRPVPSIWAVRRS